MAAGGAQRDFVGHGRDTPLERWPDGSLLAVNVVVNVEEGAEASWADGEGNDSWGEYTIPIDEKVRDLGTEGHFEFGSRVGIWRLVRLVERFDVPVFAYQVSGEYAMIEAAAAAGAGDRDALVLETLTAFKRAGCAGVLTYHAPRAAELLG